MRLLTLKWNPPSRPAYLARCLLIMVKAKGPKSRPPGYGRQFAEATNTIVAAADERDESSAIGADTVGMLRTRSLPEADEFPYKKIIPISKEEVVMDTKTFR